MANKDKILIVTDTCCDIPFGLAKELGLVTLPLHFHFEGDPYDYKDDLNHSEMPIKVFYNRLRNKEIAQTSQGSTQEIYDILEPYAKDGYKIICIIFSAALSGMINNVNIVKNMLREKYPKLVMNPIDSKCCSLGEGLLVYSTVKQKENGATYEKLINFIEATKTHVHHYFTVGDLGVLKRGGRLSASKAFIANLLNLKPVLHVDNLGRLVPLCKKFGRKQSLIQIVQYYKDNCDHNDVIFISHGDCYDDAKFVKDKILEVNKDNKVFIINEVGPVIGAHSGPETIALFFISSKDRLN
ncbi:MAG: DegV family protein [Erysipelotrichaceae bacterium]|jgi:DegV family protein with EDD domain|nr:DegV family protein [Erysipelotrichaceae bacterium]